MRVTNKMLANSYLSDMNVNLNNMKTLQKQMATGKKFSKPSDDPFNVARSMQMNTQINTNTQYNKNITNTINWLDTTDTALGQVNNVFQSVREKLVAAGNAAYDSDERQKIKDEINQRVSQISQILNTSFDGEYVFGGTKGASKPVIASQNYIVNKSNANGGDITFSGTSTDTANTRYKLTVNNTDGKGNVTELSCSKSTDGGKTWNDVVNNQTITGNTFTVSGMTVNIKSNPNTTSNDTYTFSLVKNTQLSYISDDNTTIKDLKSVVSDSFTAANWSGKDITFNVNGSDTDTKITLGSISDLDEAIKEINDKISANTSLSGKIVAQKTEDGKIKFNSLVNDNIWIEDTTVTDFTMEKSILPSTQMDRIKSIRQTEISQGVLVKYNVSADSVMNFEKKDGTSDNIASLLQRIVNHLDGNDDNGIKSASATTELTTDDLNDLDSAMAQILKVRSEVGSMQNRMDSAKDQNEQSNIDMTEILAKTEDIDITEKTMEYATMQTVYLASLQTSAKVLQPTLMDYMR